jgi:hypothetical protein
LGALGTKALLLGPIPSANDPVLPTGFPESAGGVAGGMEVLIIFSLWATGW